MKDDLYIRKTCHFRDRFSLWRAEVKRKTPASLAAARAVICAAEVK